MEWSERDPVDCVWLAPWCWREACVAMYEDMVVCICARVWHGFCAVYVCVCLLGTEGSAAGCLSSAQLLFLPLCAQRSSSPSHVSVCACSVSGVSWEPVEEREHGVSKPRSGLPCPITPFPPTMPLRDRLLCPKSWSILPNKTKAFHRAANSRVGERIFPRDTGYCVGRQDQLTEIQAQCRVSRVP